MSFDLAAVRAQFPILQETVRGKRLAYLDNAATTQKPQAVLDRIAHYYAHENANVHRAVHLLAERATAAYEGARDRIAGFVGADREEIVFTRGTTEAINLVARSYLQPRLQPGDEVLLTGMEHHSNIVPWQLAGAKTVAAPVRDDGSLDLDAWRAMINPRTRLVAVVQVSNALGTVNPVSEMIAIAHAAGVPVLVDGAQSLTHLALDLHALGADFFTTSAHKAFGPTGFGFLYAKREHLEDMPPWHGGGDMIETVAFEGSTWNQIPYKFEAGTPDMAGAIGFATALDWIEALGLPQLIAHDAALTAYTAERLAGIDGLRVLGTAAGKIGVFSLVLDGAHPHDLGSLLSEAGVAVRTGHHCTMPLWQRYGVPATARASLSVYNGEDDIDQLVDGLRVAKRLLLG
jgi:cysteine desulfurase / selenocysteine lyase